MARSRKINIGLQIGDEQTLGTVTVSAGTAVSVDESIPSEASGHAIAFTLDVSACKLLYMLADKDMTVTFSHSGGPTSISLAAGVPFLWFVNCGFAFPISADVTVSEVDNSASAVGNLRIEVLVDPTP